MKEILARALREDNHLLLERLDVSDAVYTLTETEATQLLDCCYRSWPNSLSPWERITLGEFMAIIQAAHGLRLPEHTRQGVDQEAVE
jgi:hypothetical protein